MRDFLCKNLTVFCTLSLISAAFSTEQDAAKKEELSRLTREVKPLWYSSPAEKGNVARGKKYTLYPKPNMGNCTNATDLQDLTEGKFLDNASGLWFNPTTVGWARAKYIEITIDLEKVQSVNRLKLFTGGGRAGVNLPNKIDICGSIDGKNFYQIADLVSISKVRPPMPNAGYHYFVFEGDFSPVNARYIRLRLCPNGEYFALSEVEVFKSSAAGKNITELPPVCPLQQFMELAQKASIGNAVKFNMFKLVDKLPASVRADAEKIVRNWSFSGNAKTFKGIYPYDDMQLKVFAKNAEAARAAGKAGVQFAVTGFYQSLSPVAMPESKGNVIKQTLQNGEKRGAAVVLFNTGTKSVKVSAKLKGVSGDLFNTKFVDSEYYNVTSTVLFPHTEFDAIPGMTNQIAITFTPEGLPAGIHKGVLEISYDGKVKSIPVELTILPGTFPKRPRLHCSGWEYLDLMSPKAKNAWQGIPGNLFSSFREMRNKSLCFGTVGMSIRERALQPTSIKVDSEGNILSDLTLKDFEDWVSQNPDASYYGLVALGLPRKNNYFGDKKLKPGTPAFNKAVTAWGKIWNDRILKLGLKGKVFFQLFDEPDDEAQYKNIQMWHTAFRKGAPDIPLAITPCWKYDPAWNKYLSNDEIIIPEVELLQVTDEASKKRIAGFRELQKKGHVFHVYSCSFGPFLGEPGAFRNQAWMAFAFDAVSSNFWGSTNINETYCFNRYISNNQYYSPYFVYDGKLVSSKHDVAHRDGIQDFEYLVLCRDLLKKAAASGQNVKALQAEFDALVKEVAAPRQKFQGVGNDMAEKAEEARLKIISIIQKLNKK